MKKTFLSLVALGLMIVPNLLFAQALHRATFNVIVFIDEVLIPFAFVLAIFLFLVGVLKFVIQAGSEEGRKQGQRLILWGLVSIVVMVSLWGIVNFIMRDLGISGITEIPIKAPGQ